MPVKRKDPAAFNQIQTLDLLTDIHSFFFLVEDIFFGAIVNKCM